jgi:hypothetical protein
MRSFLFTLLASTIASIMLWNFGVAHIIWPAHPLLATTVIAAIFAILVQSLLSKDAATRAKQSQK